MNLLFITSPLLICLFFASLFFDVLMFVLPKRETLFGIFSMLSLSGYVLSAVLLGCELVEMLAFVLVLACLFFLFVVISRRRTA